MPIANVRKEETQSMPGKDSQWQALTMHRSDTSGAIFGTDPPLSPILTLDNAAMPQGSDKMCRRCIFSDGATPAE